ncbi:MAG: tRNA preQ1(34) S-adenosylmethionine ribosyltransferase-isomerase QueA [Clostridiales bacterium]|nr:tRNA preQ1(34) S-adenosylmethionine ribosyltransferase-isomerase QueA [Clostridiales bacterium]
MKVSDFDYELPKELIAQQPCERRDASRMLVVDRKSGEFLHRHFYDVLEYVNPGDCLVFNDSKVIPARLYGTKESSGARVEFLLLKRVEGDLWESLVRPGRRLGDGDIVVFGENGELRGEITGRGEDGSRLVKFAYSGDFMPLLEKLGAMPLPPYIERAAREEDKERYQNVYASQEGSVACATAGLHWTPELLRKAKEKGIKIAYVTLHVGLGTFRPVKAENVEDHHMHFEEYSVSEEAARIVNETRNAGGRIVAVGTTACRTLESACADGELLPGSGSTGIFIYPGYEFKLTDRLITNFHLPKSTLLMLVSAFYTRKGMLEAYGEAVRERYRFFSYGDCCFIL